MMILEWRFLFCCERGDNLHESKSRVGRKRKRHKRGRRSLFLTNPRERGRCERAHNNRNCSTLSCCWDNKEWFLRRVCDNFLCCETTTVVIVVVHVQQESCIWWRRATTATTTTIIRQQSLRRSRRLLHNPVLLRCQSQSQRQRKKYQQEWRLLMEEHYNNKQRSRDWCVWSGQESRHLLILCVRQEKTRQLSSFSSSSSSSS